jgi:hypothetical protein
MYDPTRMTWSDRSSPGMLLYTDSYGGGRRRGLAEWTGETDRADVARTRLEEPEKRSPQWLVRREQRGIDKEVLPCGASTFMRI